jgi:alkanesulfonate monooxygenase SsuD/methylene tetrahydromethanopterin reductase-like flavin-dependent oxidoreductase (luciferase family)
VYSNALIACVGKDEKEIARRAAVIGRDVDELRLNGLCGTPGEAVERLLEWKATGSQRVYLQMLDLDDLDHLDLIATEVMPHVA